MVGIKGEKTTLERKLIKKIPTRKRIGPTKGRNDWEGSLCPAGLEASIFDTGV
jgi:hypothetical protein